MKNVRVELADELHIKLKMHAVKEQTTIQKLVVGLIKKFIEEEEKKQ